MGADGGVKITPISYIRNDWKKIKHSLLDTLRNELNTATSDSFEDKWDRDHHPIYIDQVEKWPESVRFKTNTYIHKLLNTTFHSCDCPGLFQDKYIITGEGDNVSNLMNALSHVLPGEYFETWT